MTPSSTSGRAVESQSEQGKTTIEDTVVAKIASLAAREVTGVHELTTSGVGGTISGLASGLASRVGGGGVAGNQSGPNTQGVSVVVGQLEAAVDLAMTVDYGVSIQQVADAVRNNVVGRIGAMTGLRVKEVNIDVTDLYFPQDQANQQARVQ
jgi:uncharacterized alkaline shock family protein YloU